jgi:molecular chaperone GrpE (heat shock protein)
MIAMPREEILQRFAQLLDTALEREAPPAGMDPEILSGPERICDDYSLWAAMTALTQEVKLQGRAFQELNHTLEAQTGRMLEELRAAYTERERTLQRETERRCRREVLGALIDLRDRLARGRESARASKLQTGQEAAGWLERMFARPDERGAEAVAALVRGYELGMERLDRALDEFNAHEIRCEGEVFDPRRMNAIDSAESAGVPEGTVLEVYRSGYEWNDEVFRPAQVKVSRAPAAEK